jgi:hypothetical protein
MCGGRIGNTAAAFGEIDLMAAVAADGLAHRIHDVGSRVASIRVCRLLARSPAASVSPLV